MIAYKDSIKDVSREKLQGFFAGWQNPRSPSEHLEILRGSDEVVLAVDEKTADVVGFITAITDAKLAAYIPLLEVLPAYKNKGIGTQLVRQMLVKLKDYYMVDVVCDEDIQPFYERLGFVKAKAMIIRRYQSRAEQEG